MRYWARFVGLVLLFLTAISAARAATSIPLTVHLSESVFVAGTPRVAVDVGGQTRYATYTSGSGTNALTFTLSPQAGDVDLDGITVSSPIDLNGGTIKDIGGNDLASLAFTPPNTSGIKVNYPSLGMDFVYDADGRYTLNGTAYNDLTSFLAASGGTFTRASIGTYYDSAGTLQTAASGVPRFDWDPITHAAKGILIEESRTNLYKYAADFSNALWVKARSIILTNATQAPDGTMTAAHLSDNGVSGGSYIRQSLSYSANTKYAISIYAKKAELDRPRIDWNDGSGWASDGMVIFNLTTGTATTSGTVDSYSIVSVGNGWYRCTAVATFGAVAQSSNYPAFTMHTNLLDSTSGFYVWGAQIEQASFSSSYIPTTAATVTRAADVLSVPSGAWLNASLGTLSALGTIPYVGGTAYPGLAALKSGATDAIHIFVADGAMDARQAEIWTAGSGLFSSAVGNYTAGGSFYGALAYQVNDAIFSVNGTLGALNTTVGALPSVSTLSVGANRSGALLNGWLEKLKYYPARISSSQLQLLTQ